MGMKDKKREKGGRVELRAGFHLGSCLGTIPLAESRMVGVAPLPSVQFFPPGDPPAEG